MAAGKGMTWKRNERDRACEERKDTRERVDPLIIASVQDCWHEKLH